MSEQDLKTLILENPELPVVVAVSDEDGKKYFYAEPYGHIGEMTEHDGKICKCIILEL